LLIQCPISALFESIKRGEETSHTMEVSDEEQQTDPGSLRRTCCGFSVRASDCDCLLAKPCAWRPRSQTLDSTNKGLGFGNPNWVYNNTRGGGSVGIRNNYPRSGNGSVYFNSTRQLVARRTSSISPAL
jgi:hypothetical protein